MSTLLLDQATWDLVLDASGDIALADDPYATAQDVACANRTFLGECWYDTTIGIPYFESVLGKNPSLGWLKTQYIAAASAVQNVVNPVVYFSGLSGRQLTGQMQFTLATTGATVVVGIGAAPFILDVSTLGGSNVI